MGGHIIRPLSPVEIKCRVMRREAAHRSLQIHLNVRVRIFLNCQRGGGVATHERQQTFASTCIGHHSRNLTREIGEAGALGFNENRLARLFHKRMIDGFREERQ